MLKHSCKGKLLRKNVKFIAACNPYRLKHKSNDNEIIGLYDETKYITRNLVYNVNPLPNSLLNIVFDFGTPGNEDIKRYIESMLSNILNKIITDKKQFNIIKGIAENAIFDAQEFIKTNFENFSVSLREVRRWVILFEWFYNLLKKKYLEKRIEKIKENIYIYSINLSIYLCYYIRIYDKNLRNKFSEIMKKSFGQKFVFEEFPEKIEIIIADAVELEKGIAKNKTLLENLFAIFVCLNTKIPLFIVGKPGCSKSLSAQYIFKSMNGKDSSNVFFQYFPKVFTNSYQGSLTSDSKSILKLFKKARKSIENNSMKNEIIQAIFFDELGLAEISKNNPLKVIHSELEYDENKDKVAFLGISNWPLDASKMNRGICLSICESDKNDLIKTAIEIAKSYDLRLIQDYKQYFEYLALTYFDFKEKLKNVPHDFEKNINRNTREFLGKRDFFQLIKIASKLFIKYNFPKENYEIENILNESIERNFGGLENSIKIFKKLFKKYVPNIIEINDYKVMDCIKENILDSSNRYLLIITKSSISQFLVKSILDDLNKKYIFYYGSNFEEDNLKGYYSAKVLNKIQITMSRDNVMVLKNLNGMYPSLYDLFNQNFRKIGDSNYARIALGDSNTQNYFVNKDLRCIVIIDKNEIDKQDPPFLNRFEKHILTFEYLLSEYQKKISENIIKIFNGLIKNKNDKLKNCLKNQLINCDSEEIKGIVFQISEILKKEKSRKSKDNNLEKDDEFENSIINTETNDDNNFFENNLNIYKKKIFKKIIPTFSQDLIFFSKNSDFAQKYKEEFNTITKIFFKKQHQHKNLKSYLEKIDYNKHIIYTFSNILDSLYGINIKNEKFTCFIQNRTKNDIFVEKFISEREIDEQISDFYLNKNDYNLCMFHYNIDDCIHLNHIHNLIEAKENMLKDEGININSKVILFIIHLKRKTFDLDEEYQIPNEYLISHLTKWKQFFIDNLNGKDIDFKKVFDSSNLDLFQNKDLIDLEEEFSKDLYHAFSYISYNIKINLSDIKNDDYIEKVCEYINQDKNFKDLIQKIIKNKLMNIKEDIILNFFNEYNFEQSDVDFISTFIKYIKSIYNRKLIDTLIQLERNNLLSTQLMSPLEMKNEYFDKIIENNLDQKFQNYATFSQTIKINTLLGICYPFIISLFSEINNYTNTIIEDYFENEDKYRSEQFDDINEYFEIKNNLENNIKREFEKKYFVFLFDENSENLNLNIPKLRQILFNDYIIYYLSKSNIYFSNKNILIIFTELFKLFLSRENDKQNENGFIENKNIFSLENISKFVLFIECYKNYLYSLIKFICDMDFYINNFISDYSKCISSEKFKMTNKNISYVNDIFFNLFESINYCIINIKKPFTEFSNSNFNNFLNEIKLFTNMMMNNNIELRLTLKQILYLFDFIDVKEFFSQNGINLKKHLQIYLNILSQEDEFYLMPIDLNNDRNKTKDIIVEEFSYLEKLISNKKEYPKLIAKLLDNKFKISKEDNYRIKILKILFSNNLFIIKNKVIFETVLGEYDICPNKIKKNENDKEEENDSVEDNQDDGDGTGELFLSQLNEDKDNLIIQFLNKSDNISFDEILISLFDEKIMNYFENIKNEEDLILNQSFEIFTKCVKYIENTIKEISNNKLGVLYCISYIKLYCFYLSKIIIGEEFENIDKEKIYSFLNDNNKFRKVIKIYILKVINLHIIKNYNNFLYKIEQKQIFYNDFIFDEKSRCSLNFLFINNGKFNYYKDLRKKYISSKRENYRTNKEIIDSINNNSDNFLVFYDLIINEEISNLINEFKQDIYTRLSHLLLDIPKKLNLNKITEELLNLFYNIIYFKDKILPLIKNISPINYEILLYSHKFAVISSMSKKKSIYSKIFSQSIIDDLKKLYLPGGEPNDSMKIKSGEEIQKYLNSGAVDAVYMCSCNYWYVIGNCGLPMERNYCRNCGQAIGGNNHRLLARPGHFRIIRDNEINDGTKKYLSVLMKEVEQEKNSHFTGFKKVRYDFFIDQNKNVRNMSNITYRILSFIFYSCVYYSEKLGYIYPNELHNFYFIDENKKNKNDFGIFFILEKTWHILADELSKREVKNIQCFLNMIIPEFTKIIVENEKEMKNNEERQEFENLCNQVFENAIMNYKNYYNKYINNNKELLEIENTSMKSILHETSNINNLSEQDFPLIKYFYFANYPNYELFSEQFELISDPILKFPVLTSYLVAKQDESIEILKYFNNINPFVNYVLEKYSNKITREEAKITKIKDELINDKKMEKLFNNFKIGWKNIYKKLSNYDCHGKLPEKNITEEDCLAFCLNDNFEDNYGKYIATAYKDFITYQNNFLKNLIENNSNKEYLYCYANQIKKEIKAQHASPNEVVSLDISNNYYDSFEDLIYSFSYRNCFEKNGTVNYINYKENKFDFDSIEKELSKILLPHKRLFANEQNQDFITYAFEGFNQNECIILDFKEKIKEIKYLTKEEKMNLSNIFKKIDYKLLLFDLQSLFLYFNTKRNIDGNESLIEEINNLPKNIVKIDEEIVNNFKNYNFNINLNKLIDCYEYIEFYNYDKILIYVSKKINENLNEEQIKKLNEHFSNENQLLISKKDLGNAVRKFICRFLIGEKFKNIDWNIILFLREKKELWNDKINSEENENKFKEEMDKLDSFNIIINQSIDFYEKLGGERAEKEQNEENENSKRKTNKTKGKKGKRKLDY